MATPYFEIHWDPVTGCSEVSEGCKNCFGTIYAPFLKRIGIPAYRNGFEFTIHERELHRIKKLGNIPAKIFPSRMSDLFQPKVPDYFIKEVLSIISSMSQEFGILTKHAYRLPEFIYPDNLHLGITVETPDHYDRILHLKKAKAKNKHLALMPLICPHPALKEHLEGIEFVVLYEEKGVKFPRYCDPRWVYEIDYQCKEAKVQLWNYFRVHDIGAEEWYRGAMALQLFDPLPGGITGHPLTTYPQLHKLRSFYMNKLRHLSLEELIAKVRQVDPEFFEG